MQSQKNQSIQSQTQVRPQHTDYDASRPGIAAIGGLAIIFIGFFVVIYYDSIKAFLGLE